MKTLRTLSVEAMEDNVGICPRGANDNCHAYVANDPLNFTDPSGLDEQEIVVTGSRSCNVRIDDVCVDGSVVGPIIYGEDTVTFTVSGLPDIVSGTPCTSSGSQVTCRVGRNAPQPPCAVSGPVIFGGVGAEGHLIRGLGGTAGGYWDTVTGESGLFGSEESGYGWGAGFGGQLGIALDMNSFSGDYSVIGGGTGPLGFNYSYRRGDFWDGLSFSITYGVNVMPFPPAVQPFSFHYSEGSTIAIPFSGTRPEC